jgi:hypothetical protein
MPYTGLAEKVTTYVVLNRIIRYLLAVIINTKMSMGYRHVHG